MTDPTPSAPSIVPSPPDDTINLAFGAVTVNLESEPATILVAIPRAAFERSLRDGTFILDDLRQIGVNLKVVVCACESTPHGLTLIQSAIARIKANFAPAHKTLQ